MTRTSILAATAACLALVSGTLVSGCASPRPGVDRWQCYEECVAALCRDPGGADAPALIRRLSADIQKVEAAGLKVPPGVHAQLGYLYYLTGSYESAATEFTAEKELYPESAVFMDGILRRMGASPAAPTRAET